LLVKRASLLNATFAMAILDLISLVHLASFGQANQIVEIFNILHLFLIYRKLNKEWLSSFILSSPLFSHIHFHSLASSNFN
jgi:hypothetical protein